MLNNIIFNVNILELHAFLQGINPYTFYITQNKLESTTKNNRTMNFIIFFKSQCHNSEIHNQIRKYKN